MLSRKYLQECVESDWRGRKQRWSGGGRLERSMIVKAEFPKRDVMALSELGDSTGLCLNLHIFILCL